jgi:DNA adenine methylase
MEDIELLEQNLNKCSINNTTNDDIKNNNIKNSNKNNIKYYKPIVKWIGGKTQIINDIINKFPVNIKNYHELFLGGGSVLIALLQNIENKNIVVKELIYAYDINETLINMYINIQKQQSTEIQIMN